MGLVEVVGRGGSERMLCHGRGLAEKVRFAPREAVKRADETRKEATGTAVGERVRHAIVETAVASL